VVRSDFDRRVDLSSYHTFGFPENTGTDRGGYTTLITTYLKDAVRREMTVRGYAYSETSPDLFVNFYSDVRDKTQVYGYGGYPWYGGAFAFHGAYGYRHYPYGFYGGWPYYYPPYDVVQYQSGTLRLDLVDAKLKQVVWEASAEERLSDEEQNNVQPLVGRLVTDMFTKFPRKGP